MGLTLREGNREYFYEQLDKYYPGLSEIYKKKYGNSYEVMSNNNSKLMKIFYDICKKNNIVCDNNEIFKYLHEYPSDKYEQLKLF
jgi:hypothetical protein